MTGTVQSVSGSTVTISGATYAFGEGVRWLLERCVGYDVEFVAISGRVTRVERTSPSASRTEA